MNAEIPEEDCTLVIPAYNEEERIENLLIECLDFHGEVIVVIDGSDRTGDVVASFKEEHPGTGIIALYSETRLGKGGGIAMGMKSASRSYIGYLDADGAAGISEMKKLFARLDRYDGVIGSRWVEGAHLPTPQSMTRKIQSRIFNIIIHILFGISFLDTQCGAKAFRREVIEDVLDTIRATGFEFDVELIWKAEKAGFTILEQPIVWSDKGGSTVRIPDTLAMLVGLLKIRFS
ncbi:MAG: glycosyltransferase family 2 protein [Methanocalculus sp. MSAO_Arc1]|uniref:dolichyl-phosphate beta-glucosyltransferase n=1 Tax=Methanocalculus TaxID=71151 RepID=UPI000FF4E7EC|nr:MULTISPECIES: dolichyl-phosphate beta-glucosyltransferase [unclassified Methanocalculus]MCP1662172.1 glycosyltransferase involved in cell wall biosynthesis [Methanocalculus sp. AMF5]RQD79098.1 MAG: glycosyltransferase family 2 protein [Methanocalculus sp. MSAO_Arc1]